MIGPLLQAAAVPVGFFVAVAIVLRLGGAWDRAANAAAGFHTYGSTPYAAWADDQTTPHHGGMR